MRSIGLILAFLLPGIGAGCQSPSASQVEAEHRDQAIRNPMQYNPAEGMQRDVSGGGLFNYDKNAMGKDLDSALNP